MNEGTRYILEGEAPVICEDEAIWREFMRAPENISIGDTQVGKFQVLTLFLGFNSGSREKPIFFQTTIIGAYGNTPEHATTLEQAKDNHQGNVNVSNAIVKHQADVAAGKAPKPFKPVECLILDDGMHCVLESVECAKEAFADGGSSWELRGNTLVFLVGRRDPSHPDS